MPALPTPGRRLLRPASVRGLSAPSSRELRVGPHSYRVAHWPGQASQRPLFALHGFTGAGSDWAPLIERLGQPAWAPDLLGHAGSAAPRAPEDYALLAQASALARLPGLCGLERPLLLGYSYGGRLALLLLAAQPEAFAGAVLIGARAGLSGEARAARLAEDEGRARELEAVGAEAWLQAWAKRPLLATQERIEARFHPLRATERARHSTHGLAHALREGGAGRMPAGLLQELEAVRCPVLLLTGAEDPKFCALAGELAEALPQAQRVQIPGAGHCAHLEGPEPAARAIEAFQAEL